MFGVAIAGYPDVGDWSLPEVPSQVFLARLLAPIHSWLSVNLLLPTGTYLTS